MDELRLDVVQRAASIVLWTVGVVLVTLPLLAGSTLRPARLLVAAVGVLTCLLAYAQGRSGYTTSGEVIEVRTGLGRRVLSASEVECAVVARTRLSAFPALELSNGACLENRFLRVWTPRPPGIEAPAPGALFETELVTLVDRLNEWLRNARNA